MRRLNGEPTSGGVGEGRPPTLANRETAKRVGEAARGRFAESIDSTGKILAMLAGLGAFFVAAGYFVEWQRFRQGQIPSEQALPLVAKDQIAAAGVRELVISVLFVLLSLLLLGFVLFRIARWARRRSGRLACALNRLLDSAIALPTAIVGGLTLLMVPRNEVGVIVAAIVTGLFLYGLLLIRRFLETDGQGSFPLWQLVLAVGVAAVVLAGARQSEFPEARPDALVCLSDGTEYEGDYIASDSEKILLRKRRRSDHEKSLLELVEKKREEADRERTEEDFAAARKARGREEEFKKEFAIKSKGKRQDGLECSASVDSPKNVRRRRILKRPLLIVVPRSQVEEVLIAKSYRVLPYDNSLIGRLISGVPWLGGIEFSCIPPECRWGEDTRIGPSTYL